MVLATKKNCQRVLAASLRVVSAMTGNPPLSMCLPPCPKEHITAPQVSTAKIPCERLLLSPCIMCVQYRGDAQYRGGVQYCGGIS